MEIAVLADIHSNHVALERCMRYAEERGIRQFLFLGDYVGEFAYPERTMELLRGYEEKYDCTFIRGNKENYWLSYRDRGEEGWLEYSSTTGALFYAYHHLSARTLHFFDSLPVSRKLQYGGLPTLLVCHGSPDSVRGHMLPGNEETKSVLESSEVDVILYGHTHVQGKTLHKGKVALNPGSVGVPLRADGKTQFMILHGEEAQWREEFISLEYDRERVIRELYASELMERAPYWCMITERLLRNELPEEVAHARILERVMELCRKDTGECSWPDIPEKYWKQAVEQLLGASCSGG